MSIEKWKEGKSAHLSKACQAGTFLAFMAVEVLKSF